jgi:hypothetical protein
MSYEVNNFQIATWDEKRVIDYIPDMHKVEDDLEQMIQYLANSGLKYAIEGSHALIDIEDGNLTIGIWSQYGSPLFEINLGDQINLADISENCDPDNYARMAEIFENSAKGIRAHIKARDEDG